MPSDFPADPDDVTPAWLASVLEVPAIEALAHEAVGTGQMARSHRFTFTSGDEVRSVVCKFPSNEAAVRELGARAYVKEVSFYRDIGPRAGALVPRCHHADMNAAGDTFVLVLEDLAPAAPGDQLRGCTVTEARRCVENLARLHAATWDGAGVSELAWMTDDGDAPLSAYMAMAHPPFVERFRDRLSAEALDVLAAFTAHADRWADSHPPTSAAVHGDYRLDNLLFHPTDGTVAAVDWQTVSLGNPGRDLAYFLGNSLTIDDRRAHEHDLITRYLEVLRAHGVEGYDLGRCHADYRHGSFQGPLVTMLGAFTATKTDRGEDMFTAMAERAAAQIRDHAALELLS